MIRRKQRHLPPTAAKKTQHGYSLINRCRIYCAHHIQCFNQGLDGLWRTPLATMMTFTVMGIAIAFPTGLYVCMHNVHALTARWESTATFSVFMRTDTPRQQTQRLANSLSAHADIMNTHVIHKEDALQTLYQTLATKPNSVLSDNPLPDVIVVTPRAPLSAHKARQLQAMLSAYPAVDLAQFDLDWLEKVNHISLFAQRLAFLLACVFFIAVILICWNTTRLTVERHRQEINVMRLLGATQAYIRRPFLYSGLCCGVVGGLQAIVIINISFWYLDQPVTRIARAYGSNFHIIGLNSHEMAILILLSVCLGLTGAGLAARQRVGETPL